MNNITINPIHKSLPINTTGTDFIIGDIHANINILEYILKSIQFTQSTDRLICTGDIIDRGQHNIQSLNLLQQPWFHSTLGNHESLMIHSILHNSNDHLICWIQNGGSWHTSLPKQQLLSLATSLTTLPLIITVHNQFHITHAELIHINNQPNSTHNILQHQHHKHTLIHDNILWGRSIINNIHKTKQIPPPNNQLITFTGHSIIKFPTLHQQHLFIDNNISRKLPKQPIYIIAIPQSNISLAHIITIQYNTITQYHNLPNNQFINNNIS